jgi:tRNA A37 N6-isopentenylltransferase MiaA
MIKLIIETLQLEDHYGQSELIEIAKGKYELNNTFKKGIKQLKRQIKWLKSKQ